MWGEYLEEVHMGTNPNPTLTRMVDCFGWGRAKKMDFSGWNFGALTSLSRNWYSNGSQLKEIYWGYDYGKGFKEKTTGASGYELKFSSYPLIYESAIQIINSLYDLKQAYKDNLGIDTYYKQYLRLSSGTKATLTAEEIAIATNKGWIVA